MPKVQDVPGRSKNAARDVTGVTGSRASPACRDPRPHRWPPGQPGHGRMSSRPAAMSNPRASRTVDSSPNLNTYGSTCHQSSNHLRELKAQGTETSHSVTTSESSKLKGGGGKKNSAGARNWWHKTATWVKAGARFGSPAFPCKISGLGLSCPDRAAGTCSHVIGN